MTVVGVKCFSVCCCPPVCRLLYLLQQSSSSLELRTECSVVLGSLAMGTENNIKSLLDCQIIPSLLQGGTAHRYSIILTSQSKFQRRRFIPYLSCARRSSVPRSGIYWSLPSMSQNSLHQPSHAHASPLRCRSSFLLCAHTLHLLESTFLTNTSLLTCIGTSRSSKKALRDTWNYWELCQCPKKIL